MATFPGATYVGMGATAGASLIGAGAQLAGGQNAMQNAQYQAAQSMQNAQGAFASGSSDVNNIYTQMQLTQSRGLAVAAASGANALSPSVVNLAALNAGYGVFNQSMAAYNAQTKANASTNQANADIYQGQQQQQAANMQATGTILSGVGSLARLGGAFSGGGFGTGA